MNETPSVTINSTHLHTLTINIYPNCDLKALFTHAVETLKQLVNICYDLPLIPGDRYRELYEIHVDNKSCCSLQFNPLLETNAPFRLIIKTLVGSDEERRRIKRVLTEIFGIDYERHMRTAVITGYELVVVVSGAKLDELVVYDDTKRVSARYYNEHGQLSSIRLGSDTSDQQIVITEHLSVRISNSLGSDRSKESSNSVHITAKVKCATTPVQSIFSMENPLAALSIMRLPAILQSQGTIAWLGFLDSCLHRGMQAALARIPKPGIRKKFRSRIGKQLGVNWWLPASIWSAFPSLVMGLGLIPADSSIQPRPLIDKKKCEDQEADYDC